MIVFDNFWTTNFNYWLSKNSQKVKNEQNRWGTLWNEMQSIFMCFNAADKAAALSACGSLILEKNCMLLWFQASGKLNVWIFPKQSWSWLRHCNPCTPNRTAVFSAGGYNKRNTSKLSEADLLTCTPPLLAYVWTQTHTSNHSLIAHEYSAAWLIMKEQLGLHHWRESNINLNFMQQWSF